MRRTHAAAAGAASAPSAASAAGPALRLPLDHISACVGVPTAALLSLDQPTAERVFSTLLSRLSLPHVSALVASRVSERQDARSAAKVGAAPMGAAAAASAAEEAEYRAVFTRLIVQQAQALGFRGQIAPALHSLIADRKLSLRIIDFLTEKAFGAPDDTAPAETNRSDGTAGRRGPAVTAPSQRSHDEPAIPARRIRNADHEDPIDPARRRNPAAAPGPAQSDDPPPRRGAGGPVDPRRSTAPHHAQQQPPLRGARRVVDEPAEAVESEDEDDQPDFEEREAPRAHRAARSAAPASSSSFDGRFADEEFDAAPASRARSSAAAPSSSRSTLSNRRPAASSASSLSDADKSREELLVELQSERSRHSAAAAQLHSVQGMFEQLLRERGEEQFGARRVTLLKAQNLQMERQLSLVSASTESRRQALHEIGTVVGGLADSVHEAQGQEGGGAAIGPKASRRLAQLERSIEAAQQRLSRHHRPELQFSSDEHRFLAAGAVMSAESLYGGELTHLDLSRVHALESNLADLHEKLRTAHSALSQLAANSPLQTQIDDLPAVLDSVRSCAFDLQSLGVLLPSSSAFTGAHPFAPDGSDRPWRWLQPIRSALQRRGVAPAAVDSLMRRADREESLSSIKLSMLHAEIAHHRRVSSALSSAVARFVSASDRIVGAWRADNNALWSECTAELSTVVRDWQRNPTQVSVQRLLTLLQAAMPCLRPLLEFKHRRGGHTGPGAKGHSADPVEDDAEGGAMSPSGLPPIAAELQAALSDERERLQSALDQLRDQRSSIEAQAQREEQSEPKANTHPSGPSRPSSRADHSAAAAAASARDRPPSSSSGRHTQRGGSGGSAATPTAELPPFQF